MIKVYVNYFSDARIVSNKILTPIQVGRSLTKHPLDMLGDDTGDNISSQNPAFCELTGMYWAWKNDLKSDYIGFMHYRRFLDFHSKVGRPNETAHGVVVDFFDEDFFDDFGLTENRIKEFISNCDGAIPQPFDLCSAGHKSVEEQYRTSSHHHIKDFWLAEQIVSELYPCDKIYFKKMSKGTILYPCNIFIFKRSLFLEYCEWIFPILKELHKRIDITGYSSQSKRAVGFLAERLFTLFILKKKAQNPELQLKELRLVIVKETAPEPKGPRPPVTDLPVTSIVISSDRIYLPHLAALIHSIFDNAKKTSFLDLIILDGGISENEKQLLTQIPSAYSQDARITFVDMSRQFLSVETHSYFTRTTFYRLVLPDLLDDYDRILFIDTDMIVLKDLSDLYNIDLKGNTVAAVQDLVMRTFTARGVSPISGSGFKSASIYLYEYLGMGKRLDEYFQAGTILFDLKKMREKEYSKKLQNDLIDGCFWFLDQDVLNKHLLGDVLFIDNKWNSLYLDDDSLLYLKTDDLKTYEDSIHNPYVIHFAGQHKPWVNNVHPLGHYYWYYLRRTHWYEKILRNYLNKTASLYSETHQSIQNVHGSPSLTWRILRRGWRVMPNALKRAMLPLAIRVSKGTR